MADPIRTYSAADLLIIFGEDRITGFGPDDFCEVTRNEPTWVMQIGADGVATRAKSSNKSGSIKMTIAQASPANDILSAIAKIDELTGDGIKPLLVKDNLGTSLHSAQTAFLEKPADATYGREAGTREWVFMTGDLNHKPGSNPAAE